MAQVFALIAHANGKIDDSALELLAAARSTVSRRSAWDMMSQRSISSILR